MWSQDLETVSKAGRALWADSKKSDRIASETVSAVSLLDLNPERSIEKVSQALLARAERDGAQSNIDSLENPFYRLEPRDRFILSCLHLGKWSYDRLGRIFAVSSDQIASWAWSARIRLAHSPGIRRARPLFVTGSPRSGSSCPEYFENRPWTQSFLDSEISRSQKIFLQSHLESCRSCRNALENSRNLYYQVESMIPQIRTTPDTDLAIRNLKFIVKSSEKYKNPHQISFVKSIFRFIQRWDVILLLIFIAALFAFELS